MLNNRSFDLEGIPLPAQIAERIADSMREADDLFEERIVRLNSANARIMQDWSPRK